jgi:SAM-dependent methyltransferase
VAISEGAAQLYDLDPTLPDDLPFYRALLQPHYRVLELGCGTGRVLVPLASCCASIVGFDLSPEMLAICRQRLQAAGLPSGRARVELGDMAAFDRPERFELVLTPYRSFQDLVENRQVEGFFHSVRSHLAEDGSLILDAFRPEKERLQQWASAREALCWEVEDGDTVVTCHVEGLGLELDRQVQRMRLVYRRYDEGFVEEEVEAELALRYYFPEQLEALVSEHGFVVVERWGGYAGERWGEGPELLLRCAPR